MNCFMMPLTEVTAGKMVCNKHNTPVIVKYPFWQMILARLRIEASV